MARLALTLFLLVCGSPVYGATFQGQGMIVQVDAPSRTLTISHRAIKGHMPAMVMPFTLGPSQPIAPWKAGQEVTFEVEISNGHSRLRRLALIRAAPPEFPIPTPANALAIGGLVPDFQLRDEQGGMVRISSLRGRVVAVNFIYTRCPLPEVCPRLTASFAALQRKFAGQPVSLLSITLDPQFDTPPVLSAYGKQAGAHPPVWRFLTGPMPDIERAAGLFGVVYWPEEGSLTHTSRTAIIDRNGHLAALVDGSTFDFKRLADLIAAQLTSEVP